MVALWRLGGRLLAPRIAPSLAGLLPALRGLASTTACAAAAAAGDDAAAGGGPPSIAPPVLDAAKANLEAWRKRAAKEAQGRDPWDAFASKNTDVRPATRWEVAAGGGGLTVAVRWPGKRACVLGSSGGARSQPARASAGWCVLARATPLDRLAAAGRRLPPARGRSGGWGPNQPRPGPGPALLPCPCARASS